MSDIGAVEGASALLRGAETIVARATAPGRGAIAVIRISGPRAHVICAAVADRWPSTPRVATLSVVRDIDRTILDRAIVTRFDAPASFTGEDVAEIATHGGPIVSETVVATLVERGARLALPGEFTRRALLNGKLDVLQAEATGDLIAATSRAAQRTALDQLDGGLSRRVLALRRQLLGLEALLAYDIDFPEEDDGPIPRDRIASSLLEARSALSSLAATARAGELVREGALIVLAGAPNAGKSSLFNALIGQQRAIVTEIPGTTRDAIEAVMDTGRWPLRLVDTAGIRDARERVEQLGVEVARDYIGRATIVLVCGETIESLNATAGVIRSLTMASMILVATKADLRPTISAPELQRVRENTAAVSAISVSAETGSGLTDLVELIQGQLDSSVGFPNVDAPVLTHARHRSAIAQASNELEQFRDAWETEAIPVTIAAVHLRAAVMVLEDLIGAVDVETILDELFSRFCVGK